MLHVLFTLLGVAMGMSVPISLVIPTNAEDFIYFPVIMASIANQTVSARETIIVCNLPSEHFDGLLLLDSGRSISGREAMVNHGATDEAPPGGMSILNTRYRSSSKVVPAVEALASAFETIPTSGELVSHVLRSLPYTGEWEIHLDEGLASRTIRAGRVLVYGDGEELIDEGDHAHPRQLKDAPDVSEVVSVEDIEEHEAQEFALSGGTPFNFETYGARPKIPPFNIPAMQRDVKTFTGVRDAVRKIVAHMPPLRVSLGMVQNLRIYIRAGTHYAGSNRVFGARVARSPIVSFFDFDDFMHPQRNAILFAAFQKNPGLEALLHNYDSFGRSGWGDRMVKFLKKFKYPLDPFGQHYKFFWDKLPVSKLSPSCKDPNISGCGYSWWFPKDLGYKNPRGSSAGHNGWLTIKRNIIFEVPYPDTRRGQDSIYNWRLIKAKKNFNHIPLALGAYLRWEK